MVPCGKADNVYHAFSKKEKRGAMQELFASVMFKKQTEH
jgi:hypothetical protein